MQAADVHFTTDAEIEASLETLVAAGVPKNARDARLSAEKRDELAYHVKLARDMYVYLRRRAPHDAPPNKRKKVAEGFLSRASKLQCDLRALQSIAPGLSDLGPNSAEFDAEEIIKRVQVELQVLEDVAKAFLRELAGFPTSFQHEILIFRKQPRLYSILSSKRRSPEEELIIDFIPEVHFFIFNTWVRSTTNHRPLSPESPAARFTAEVLDLLQIRDPRDGNPYKPKQILEHWRYAQRKVGKRS